MREIKSLSDLKGKAKSYIKRSLSVKAKELTEEVKIKTREGVVKAIPGDFIVRGIEGEIYPCTRSIFLKTFYPACSDEQEAKAFDLQRYVD